MRRSDFAYDLPRELIAQHPLAKRSASRLLRLDGATGAVSDLSFVDLVDWLAPGDLLVCNNTRVIRARLYGRKETGGQVEILVERLLSETRAAAQIRASKRPQAGSRILLQDGTAIEVAGREGDGFYRIATLGGESLAALLDRAGHVPLPPYIERAAAAEDAERYQTVFATRPGAVAAPTAGLHFDAALLDALSAKGIDVAYVTLHIGAGTFQPVRSERLEEHHMHAEFVEVSPALCGAVSSARARGGRIVAAGTTSVRALETAARAGCLRPFTGDTDLFITPGFQFHVVDALITNFHLPESTLLMLVCAFGGYEHVLHAYRHAVGARYRFFSYGDAMLITRASPRPLPAREERA
jgi:S-adenosylmethionine:tRNA ribosyltransferase-isomerase